MIAISEKYISTKILALHSLTKNYMLIGEGSILKLYDTNGSFEKLQIKVFSTSTIHGIGEGKFFGKSVLILVWGQKSFVVLSLNINEIYWEYRSKEYQIEDWIVDAVISEDGLSILLSTAHNTVVNCSLLLILSDKIRIGNEQSPLCDYTHSPVICSQESIIGKSKCSENSLLYCGKIVGNSWDSFIILSGTVFGMVHIWSPAATPDCHGAIPPLISFTASKGAIFSISYDKASNVLATTADDRSVKLWRVIFKECQNSFESPLMSTHLKWQNCQLVDVFCTYGHSARVWCSLILEDSSVISAGEDATVCHWNKDGSLRGSWKAHSSSSLWCLAAYNNILFTGGNDGSVKRWKLNIENFGNTLKLDIPLSADSNLLKTDFEDNDKNESNTPNTIQGTQSLRHLTKKKSSLRSVNLINHNEVAVVCDDGCLWSYNIYNKTWRKTFSHQLLKGYVITAINMDSSLLCLGTLSGTVIALKTDTWECICEQKVSSVKIQSLIFIDTETLVTSSSCGDIQVHKCHFKSGNMLNLECKESYKLPPCRQRWITAASSLYIMTVERYYLVVGDSSGNVYLYTNKQIDPISRLVSLHGRNGVTSLVTKGKFIVTTGRDGFLRYTIIENDQLSCICHLKLGFASWIGTVFDLNANLMAVAFNGNKLLLWDIDGERVISEINCGGGHRSWDMLFNRKRLACSGAYEILKDDGDIEFICAFIKDAVPQVWSSSLSERMLPNLMSPTSGREILCFEPLIIQNTETIVVFGGEDTLLHSHLLIESGMMRKNSIKSHLSSIRCITKVKSLVNLNNENCLLKNFLLTCGGRAEMKVWRVFTDHQNRTDSSETSEDDDLGSQSFYINPVSTHWLKPNSDRQKVKDFDAETRYMDCLAFWTSHSEALFILASSDGFMRFFIYSVESNEFHFLREVNCNFCLLRLCLLRLAEGDYIVASTTRGSILIWDLQAVIRFAALYDPVIVDEEALAMHFNSFEPVKYAVQDSGLNSLASYERRKEKRNDNIYLAAGGDDGSVHLLRISYSPSAQLLNKLNLRILSGCRSRKHAAQITGLAWFNPTHLCSASIDQRIIIWRANHSNIVALSAFFSSIPDIQGIRLFCSSQDGEHKFDDQTESHEYTFFNQLFVFGNGIQIFNVFNKVPT